MTVLEKHPVFDELTFDNLLVCWNDSNTILCGHIFQLDHDFRVESKMIPEEYYGDVDVFGF